jgi:hypothetical protein
MWYTWRVSRKDNDYLNINDIIPFNEGDKSQDISDYHIIEIFYLNSYIKFYKESTTKSLQKGIKASGKSYLDSGSPKKTLAYSLISLQIPC